MQPQINNVSIVTRKRAHCVQLEVAQILEGCDAVAFCDKAKKSTDGKVFLSRFNFTLFCVISENLWFPLSSKLHADFPNGAFFPSDIIIKTLVMTRCHTKI